MNKLFEKVIEAAATVLVKVIDRIDRRREPRPTLPKLDDKLESIDIDEAVRKAEEERRAKYGAH